MAFTYARNTPVEDRDGDDDSSTPSSWPNNWIWPSPIEPPGPPVVQPAISFANPHLYCHGGDTILAYFDVSATLIALYEGGDDPEVVYGGPDNKASPWMFTAPSATGDHTYELTAYGSSEASPSTTDPPLTLTVLADEVEDDTQDLKLLISKPQRYDTFYDGEYFVAVIQVTSEEGVTGTCTLSQVGGSGTLHFPGDDPTLTFGGTTTEETMVDLYYALPDDLTEDSFGIKATLPITGGVTITSALRIVGIVSRYMRVTIEDSTYIPEVNSDDGEMVWFIGVKIEAMDAGEVDTDFDNNVQIYRRFLGAGQFNGDSDTLENEDTDEVYVRLLSYTGGDEWDADVTGLVPIEHRAAGVLSGVYFVSGVCVAWLQVTKDVSVISHYTPTGDPNAGYAAFMVGASTISGNSYSTTMSSDSAGVDFTRLYGTNLIDVTIGSSIKDETAVTCDINLENPVGDTVTADPDGSAVIVLTASDSNNDIVHLSTDGVIYVLFEEITLASGNWNNSLYFQISDAVGPITLIAEASVNDSEGYKPWGNDNYATWAIVLEGTVPATVTVDATTTIGCLVLDTDGADVSSLEGEDITLSATIGEDVCTVKKLVGDEFTNSITYSIADLGAGEYGIDSATTMYFNAVEGDIGEVMIVTFANTNATDDEVATTIVSANSPVVVITTADEQYVESSSFNIAGTASDADGIGDISTITHYCQPCLGQVACAKDGADWSAWTGTVNLGSPGEKTITVTATDSSSLTGDDSITVYYVTIGFEILLPIYPKYLHYEIPEEGDKATVSGAVEVSAGVVSNVTYTLTGSTTAGPIVCGNSTDWNVDHTWSGGEVSFNYGMTVVTAEVTCGALTKDTYVYVDRPAKTPVLIDYYAVGAHMHGYGYVYASDANTVMWTNQWDELNLGAVDAQVPLYDHADKGDHSTTYTPPAGARAWYTTEETPISQGYGSEYVFARYTAYGKTTDSESCTLYT